MTRRYGATAAVNAGYFILGGPYAGASTGVYQLGGEFLSSGSGRSALALCAGGRNIVARIGVFEFQGSVFAENVSFPLMGLNRSRLEQDLVLYTPALGPRTLSPAGGVEAVLDAGRRVVDLLDGSGNALIPSDGLVISGSGIGADWLRRHVRKGSKLEIDAGVKADPLPANCTPTDILGAGPQIVRGGRVLVRRENIGHEMARHPRTAFAITESGQLLFVTLDGRQAVSAGMRLDEFAQELVRIGAEEALNLDGGGSTTMVVQGQVRNSPSDGAERPVGDAVLLFSMASPDALLQTFDRLAEDSAHISPEIRAPLRAAIVSGSSLRLIETLDKENYGRVSAQARRLLGSAAPILR